MMFGSKPWRQIVSLASPLLGGLATSVWVFCLYLCLCLYPAPAAAWGHAGHKIVCEIAFQELGPAARKQVKQLVRSDPEYATFAESCIWPDTLRDNKHYDRYRPLHYVNAVRGAAHIPSPCPGGCVLSAIRDEAEKLRDSSQTPGRQANSLEALEALKFLGHFVGDVHQPLHASYSDDRGGNDRSVSWKGEPQRLHRVWDSLMVDQRTDDWRALARQLRAALTPVDRTVWHEAKPVVWANESFQLVERRVYDFEPGEDLARAYYSRNIARVEERLMAAGIRLARLLDRVFSGDPSELFQ